MSPDIPDEAVEAAFHVLYPKVPFDPQERDYLEAVAVARAALTAAYPALTRQADEKIERLTNLVATWKRAAEKNDAAVSRIARAGGTP